MIAVKVPNTDIVILQSTLSLNSAILHTVESGTIFYSSFHVQAYYYCTIYSITHSHSIQSFLTAKQIRTEFICAITSGGFLVFERGKKMERRRMIRISRACESIAFFQKHLVRDTRTCTVNVRRRNVKGSHE